MRGRGNILYIFLVICLRLATCAAITVLMDYGKKHCFYIEVAENTEYDAKAFLLSGGSVGFSVKAPDPKKYFEDKVVMRQAGLEKDDDYEDDLAGPYKHTISGDEGEYEICLFSDRRFAGGAKRINLEIVKDEGDKSKSTDDYSPGNRNAMTSVGEHMKELEELLLKIQGEQKRQEEDISGRKKAARDNHISMERSSIIETVVIVVVSVGQIMLVRHWFQGKGSLLKRWS